MGSTSIRLKQETKNVLEDIKLVPTESFDHVIKRILKSFIDCTEELDSETIDKLQNRLQDINSGRVLSTEELRSKLFGNSDEVRKSMGR